MKIVVTDAFKAAEADDDDDIDEFINLKIIVTMKRLLRPYLISITFRGGRMLTTLFNNQHIKD